MGGQKNIEAMKNLKATLKRGFTLVELIVVMVIIAILGGVGFNAFSNYIAEANLTKYEDQFSAKQNAVAPKFSKSFTDGMVMYSVERMTGTPDGVNGAAGYLFVGPFSFIPAATPADAAKLDAIPATVQLNGDNVRIVDIGTTAVTTAVPDAAFRDSVATELLVVSEQANGNVNGTYYKKITDANICNSDAFAQKSNTTTRRYVGAGAANCFIANTAEAIKLQTN